MVKAKGNLNPTIRCVYTPEGRQIKRYRNQPLATLKPKMGRYKALDLDVEWEGELKARLVVTWNAKVNKPRYLVTNLSRAEFTLKEICIAYRLRWQIELMFKQWRSYANLHAFDTSKENIAEGLIWAALCASLLKRYCAHLA